MAPFPPPDANIYTDLSSAPFEIRLLQIEGDKDNAFDDPVTVRISTFTLDQAPRYRCLSYVWGREEWKVVHVRLVENGPLYTMHVSKNLLGFLQRMRPNAHNANYPDGYLWVDAVCINQQNQREKAIQIPEMGRIYAQAGQVIAWLGWEWDRLGNAEDNGQNDHLDTEDPTERAIEAVKETANAFRQYKLTGSDPWSPEFSSFAFDQVEMHRMLQLRHFPTKLWRAVVLFLRRVWYTRAWIVQEAVLAQSLVIVCGFQVMLWDDILQASIFIQASGWYIPLANLLPNTTNENVQLPPGWQELLFAALRSRVHRTTAPAPAAELGPYERFNFDNLNVYEVLSALLRAFRHFDASQPKDKIFAPLALLREMLRQQILLLPSDSQPHHQSAAGGSAHAKSAAPVDSAPNLDYLQKTLDVFRQVTVIVLRGSRDLDLLCEVRGPTHSLDSKLSAEELHSLPSWVADYSQTMGATFSDIPGVSFNAVPLRLKRCEFLSSGTTLKVEGCPLSVIARLAPNFGDTIWKKDFRELLEFMLTLDEFQPTGEDRMAAFWRTLIADCDGQNCPADEDMALAFKQYLLMAAAISLHGDRPSTVEKAQQANADWSSWKCFDDLHYSSSMAGSLVPSVEELSSFAEKWRQAMLGGLGGLPEARKLSRPSARYANAIGRACIHRRIFVTEQGHLCLGPQAVQSGDQIWFVSGANVAFSLRPIVEEGVEVGFRLIGETYVYGYMEGRIVDEKNEDAFVELLIR